MRHFGSVINQKVAKTECGISRLTLIAANRDGRGKNSNIILIIIIITTK